MSERAGKREDRAPEDAYFTPPWCLRAYLPVLLDFASVNGNGVDLSGLDIPNGVLVYLLRVNYLASQKRNAWMRQHTPDIAILPKRPSFTGDGRTDGTEYAFFSWGANRRPGRGEVRVLNVEDCV